MEVGGSEKGKCSEEKTGGSSKEQSAYTGPAASPEIERNERPGKSSQEAGRSQP